MYGDPNRHPVEPDNPNPLDPAHDPERPDYPLPDIPHPEPPKPDEEEIRLSWRPSRSGPACGPRRWLALLQKAP